MAKSILAVRGIGPATAELLAKHGFNTAEDLATGKVKELAAVKGFSDIRAAQVITAAKALMSSEDRPEESAEAKGKKAKQGKNKKAEKKADKKQSDKAAKDKKSKDKKSKKKKDKKKKK